MGEVKVKVHIEAQGMITEVKVGDEVKTIEERGDAEFSRLHPKPVR